MMQIILFVFVCRDIMLSAIEKYELIIHSLIQYFRKMIINTILNCFHKKFWQLLKNIELILSMLCVDIDRIYYRKFVTVGLMN